MDVLTPTSSLAMMDSDIDDHDSRNIDDGEDDDFDDDIDMTLRHYADHACKKIAIGTAIMPTPLFHTDVGDYNNNDLLQDAASSLPSTRYARFVKREFNAVVLEHHLKWGPLCGETSSGSSSGGGDVTTTLGRYDFELSDRMVDWALQNKLQVKGHVLVWAVTSPPCLKELPADQVREHVKRHIFTVMNHFRGRIREWDVVNEPLAPDGSLAHNVFVDKLGIDYVAQCFQWAHEADPSAHLILNENKVEGIGQGLANGAKSEAFYQMVKELVNRGVPIHGVGLQAHWNAAGVGRNRPPTPRQVKQQINRLGQLGLTVNLSELDVRVSQLSNADLRTPAQACIYHDLVAAALSEPACNGIWLWGFSDRHTWVTHFYYDDEPCIADEEYRRKPAYYALREALQSCNVGGVVGGGNRLDPVLLDSDLDANGSAWGHVWMQPEPVYSDNSAGASDLHARQNSSLFRGGDARPDWQIEQQQQDQQQPPPQQALLFDGKELDSGEQEEEEEDGFPEEQQKQQTNQQQLQGSEFQADFVNNSDDSHGMDKTNSIHSSNIDGGVAAGGGGGGAQGGPAVDFLS